MYFLLDFNEVIFLIWMHHIQDPLDLGRSLLRWCILSVKLDAMIWLYLVTLSHWSCRESVFALALCLSKLGRLKVNVTKVCELESISYVNVLYCVFLHSHLKSGWFLLQSDRWRGLHWNAAFKQFLILLGVPLWKVIIIILLINWR